jgi:hypothetical protein
MGYVSEQPTTSPRPSQASAACLIVMLGSVFVILLMWDRVAHLHEVATRQALQAFLDRSKLASDGLDVGALVTIVKVVSMICAACAVAMVVQAWQVTKRNRNARVAVTVLAVPMFVTGLVGDGFVGSAAATFWCSGVGAAVVTLWLGPNRIWFGDPASASASARTSSQPTQAPPRGAVSHQGAGARPGPPPPASFPFSTPPPGAQTSRPVVPPGPGPAWAPPSVSAYDVGRPSVARPRALLWACLLTWVCTGIAATGLALSLAVMSADSESVMHDVYRSNPKLADQGVSQHALLAMLIAISAVVLAAAVAAAVFAVLLFRRHQWAWYALVVSASGAALLFLIGSFGSPVAIVLLGACVATIACLVRPEVRAWLLRR